MLLGASLDNKYGTATRFVITSRGKCTYRTFRGMAELKRGFSVSDITGPFGEAITVNYRLGQQHLGPSQLRSSLWYEHIRLELQISLLCVSSSKSPLGKSPSRRSAQPPFATAFDAPTFIGQYSTVQVRSLGRWLDWTGLDCVALRAG
ncbi:hypothetical protein FPSE_11116 [Fusarium pseudograminearum CS3096]|uniref:Uncharacterized protein n=1 Tax=Fusarium pseudograminearum (strain CS3096) TaxID=1028729 RepID=K3VXD7_FUSPC|nr:hypothetical protein FPSE_11116 [Fusarium pseudograminearum CS3096]EKJ68720.1 hypothetical protein FPSE_11116 [Fusarium pseudograminearum CS3096]